MIPWLPRGRADIAFPPVETALHEPNGLLAAGGDLSPERLLSAYRQGIFPWYSEGQPILWWSPDPRAVLFPERLHISRSLRKALRRSPYAITVDQDFAAVIQGCREVPRKQGPGTWIVSEMLQAYCRLHDRGHAHSIECWQGGRLVGGLYGVALGQVFFGESMFSLAPDASKIAFVHLARSGKYRLIDCQQPSEHLSRLGAECIPRREFTRLVSTYSL
jgi:leucyl/phenylalanyl-tRNA--protein transferase